MPFVNPEKFWRSERSLERARRAALGHARRLMEERRRPVDALVFEAAHAGHHHLEFFRREFPQITASLPANFQAFELGAGLGWLAFLLAGHAPGSKILATEISWAAGAPLDVPNCFTMYRMAEKEPALHKVLDFHFDEGRTLQTMSIKAPVSFALASAHDLPLADDSTDLHYSMNCLEHIPDLGKTFQEAARVLRLGGICFHTTEPLYYSPFGHHLGEFFPIPWGHLLWNAEDLADLVLREVPPEAQWLPGEPLRGDHLLNEVFPTLSGATPADLRAALVGGPWEILGWVDEMDPDVEALARTIGIGEALRGIPREALLLRGVKIKLARRQSAVGLRLPMRLGHVSRGRLRRLLGKGN